MKELKFVIFLLNFIIIANVNAQQVLPPVPCPEIFAYKWDSYNNKYYGELRVDSQNSQIIKLFVKLSILGVVTVGNFGSIDLLHGEHQAWRDVMENKPVDYKISFPPSQYIPKLTSVIVNGAVLCSGPSESSLVTNTNITLDHNLQATQTYNGPQFSSISPNQVTNLPPRNDVTFIPQAQSISTPAARPVPAQPVSVQPVPAQPLASQSAAEICGTIAAQSVGLAYGGTSIVPGSWPWLAAIYIQNGTTEIVDYAFRCGGVLVSSRIVLSAAHCFKKHGIALSAERLIVVLGRYNIYHWAEPESRIQRIDQIQIHGDYRSDLNSYDADIAVIVLHEYVTYTNYIRPACMLPPNNNANNFNEGVVVGWGKDATRPYTPEPTKVSATIVPAIKCLRSNPAFPNITTDRTLCAGNRDGNGPCSGDSGSGLLVEINNRWYLRATVAGSLHDTHTICNLREYVIYSDVTKFSTWIYSYIQAYR